MRSIITSFFELTFIDFNVEFLLKLADFFDMQPLFKDCENYLMATEGVSFARKLYLVDKLPLSIKDEIMTEIETLDDLKELAKHEEYQKLSGPFKIELMDQLAMQ